MLMTAADVAASAKAEASLREQLHTADEATIGGSKLVGSALEIAKNGPKLPQERDMVSVATPGHFWRA